MKPWLTPALLTILGSVVITLLVALHQNRRDTSMAFEKLIERVTVLEVETRGLKTKVYGRDYPFTPGPGL